MEMKYNYHAHTVFCGHATGTQEEYVQRAIDCGIEEMGFSDHFPMKAPNGTEAGWRMPVSKVQIYREETLRLREKYKDKIKLFMGFEMEYYADYFESMLSNAVSYGAEYLILGQHYVNPEFENGLHVFSDQKEDESFRQYIDMVIGAMKTGAFSYVAHPDAFCYTGENIDFYRAECRRLSVTAKELDIPFELNFLGIRSHRHYPRKELWEIVGELGVPVTFGFDAHDAPAAYDGESLAAAEEMLYRYNLNYIGKLRLIDPKEVLTRYRAK